MARIEDLIATIEEDALRGALADEVRALKRRTPFGLVFERHIPEYVLLPAAAGLQTGDQVCPRGTNPDDGVFRVLKRTKRKATLVDESGTQMSEDLENLMVVKGMGDSVYPALRPLGTIERHGSRRHHAVINGENYHALQLMEHCFAGQVDCIYIDPPYNTGARDWKYNNRFVDSADAWRHSKWLSMMERRLRIAKRLLKADGVLICTIDEHEVHHLGVLLEQLFPEYLRYMVNIVINPKGTNKANFGRVEEHAFFVVPDLGRDVIAHFPPPRDVRDTDLTASAEDLTGDEEGIWIREISDGLLQLPATLRARLDIDEDTAQVELRLDDKGVASLRPLPNDAQDLERPADGAGDGVSVLFLRRRGAESSFRHQRPNQFYAMKVNEANRKVVGVGPALGEHDTYELGYREGDVLWVYPIDEDGNERVWRYARATMQQYIDAGQIQVGTRWEDKPQTFTLNHVKPRDGERVQRLRTTWWRTAHDAGTHGTTLISRLLGTQSPFPFPKSLYAVRDCLQAVVKDRPDALIVDYFAGSGTTLHATALLNLEDGGDRRCVLVTNNEVDEKTSRKLAKAGYRSGDPEFERHGIFEATTRPRIETALTGLRPDGTPVPDGRKYRYLDGRPWTLGFDENCEFYELAYLDADDVELGRAFKAIHPLLWLMAGARGQRRDDLAPGSSYAVIADGGYAVLFEERAIRDLVAELRLTDGIQHVFLVTDSEDAYAEMAEVLGPDYTTHMLYRDYLRSFRIRAVR